MNRLCIYTVYDKDGIIDDYIIYFLSKLKPFVKHVVVVCNGKLNDDGRKKLSLFTEDIFVRPNAGYDAGAIKDVFFNLFGWDKIYAYDELLICNDTFFGPLYPFEDCFNKMDSLKVDFWGMTLYRDRKIEHPFGDRTELEHLQSFFLNVKKRLLHSSHFINFWREYDPLGKAKTAVVSGYEVAFTQKFSSYGYKYSAYIDAANKISTLLHEVYNYTFLDPMFTLRHLKCPILKKRAITDVFPGMRYYGNDETVQILNFVSCLGYDANMIWDNILRTYNLYGIVNALFLRQTLSACFAGEPPKTYKLAAVIIRAENSEYCDSEYYIKIAKERADVIILNTSNFLDKNQILETAKTLTAYDFLCVVFECGSKTRSDMSANYIRYANTLASEAYIDNVLNEFAANPRLGLAAAPKPYHGEYFAKFGERWGKKYNSVETFLRRLGVTVPLSRGMPNAVDTSAFWVRTKAVLIFLTQIVNNQDSINSEYLSIVGMALPYCAQQNGYYSMTINSDNYNRVRATDLENTLSAIVYRESRQKKFHDYESFFNSYTRFNADDIRSFCEGCDTVFIFGAGLFGKSISSLFKKHNIAFDGFVVSDGHRQSSEYLGLPLMSVSELKERHPNAGIVMAVSLKFFEEAFPALKNAGFKIYTGIILS